MYAQIIDVVCLLLAIIYTVVAENLLPVHPTSKFTTARSDRLRPVTTKNMKKYL